MATTNGKSGPDPIPFRSLLFAHGSLRPPSPLSFSLNLRLTHEHTETMRKTKRMLKGLRLDRHEKGACATVCKMYTRTCIPLARLREGISLPRRVHGDCVRGRINPFATLHLPEKRFERKCVTLGASHICTPPG